MTRRNFKILFLRKTTFYIIWRARHPESIFDGATARPPFAVIPAVLPVVNSSSPIFHSTLSPDGRTRSSCDEVFTKRRWTGTDILIFLSESTISHLFTWIYVDTTVHRSWNLIWDLVCWKFRLRFSFHLVLFLLINSVVDYRYLYQFLMNQSKKYSCSEGANSSSPI